MYLSCWSLIVCVIAAAAEHDHVKGALRVAEHRTWREGGANTCVVRLLPRRYCEDNSCVQRRAHCNKMHTVALPLLSVVVIAWALLVRCEHGAYYQRAATERVEEHKSYVTGRIASSTMKMLSAASTVTAFCWSDGRHGQRCDRHRVLPQSWNTSKRQCI